MSRDSQCPAPNNSAASLSDDAPRLEARKVGVLNRLESGDVPVGMCRFDPYSLRQTRFSMVDLAERIRRRVVAPVRRVRFSRFTPNSNGPGEVAESG